VILALLGALVLAGSARAAEAGEGALPEAGLQAPETVLSGPTPVPAPETILTGSGPEAATPPSEAPVPAPVPTAPSPETAPPVPAPSPETVRSTPAPEAATPIPTPETVLSVSGQEKTPTPEAVLSGASAPGNKGQETLVTGSGSGDQGSALVVIPTGGPQQPPGGAPGGALGLPEVATASNVGPPTVGAAAKMTVAQRAQQFDCDLSSFGEHQSSGCSAGWLGAQRLLSQSPMGLVATAASVAASAGSPPTGGHGGSGTGSPPVNPAPGPTPAPSGASGSAAGSSGIGLSGFLTLAGLLLLGAPRAMRRLRLSCQPWRTACFVLIPERPG
jgi:hypothetical protein